jgi:hypothetical protein
MKFLLQEAVFDMVSSNDFTLNSLQAAIFTQDQSVFAAGRAVATILAKFSERYDGPMQVLPLPTNTPPDIPHVHLQSSDAQWHLNMAPARIDSIWNNLPMQASPSVASVAQQCAEVQEYYLSEYHHAQVARLALVISRTCPVENPAQILIQQFCNEWSQGQPFKHSGSFEIHNHKVYTPPTEGIDYQINSWVRCKTAALVADNRPVILVEQDLNTLENTIRRFNADQIRAFFRMAAQEADEIIRLYFPGELKQ